MTTVQTNIRLDKDLRAWYDAKGAEEDRDAAYFMKKALVEFRDKFDKRSKPATLPAVKQKPKAKFDASEVDFIGLNRNSWLEWVQYRKEKKKPITKAAAKKQVETLLAFDEMTQKQMIDNSIANDYQGIFEPKPSFNGSQNYNQNDTRNLTIEHQLNDKSWAV